MDSRLRKLRSNSSADREERDGTFLPLSASPDQVFTLNELIKEGGFVWRLEREQSEAAISPYNQSLLWLLSAAPLISRLKGDKGGQSASLMRTCRHQQNCHYALIVSYI